MSKIKLNFLTQVLVIVGLSVLLALANHSFRHYFIQDIKKSTGFKRIEIEQLARLQSTGKIVLVDARPLSFYQISHISNAIHLGDEAWDQELGLLLQKWKLGEIIVVYCASNSCHQAEYTADRLSKAGLPPDHIYILDGGWQGWIQSHPEPTLQTQPNIIQPPTSPNKPSSLNEF